MRCHWKALLNLLPIWMRDDVDKFGQEKIQELRLRLNENPQIVCNHASVWLQRKCSSDDIRFCINAATQYSPWTSESVSEGFITAYGGHRIGICGEYVYEGGRIKNISRIFSLCIRVAKDIPNVSKDIYMRKGSILIIGGPGSGKTTFLRDLIRKTSEFKKGAVAVVDERRELFPFDMHYNSFLPGKQTDVLSGCCKTTGVEIAIRTMNPAVIAVDEITNAEDCLGLYHAAWSGVRLFATAHAGSKNELYARQIYQPILESKIFDTLIVLHSDKTWLEDTFIR